MGRDLLPTTAATWPDEFTPPKLTYIRKGNGQPSPNSKSYVRNVLERSRLGGLVVPRPGEDRVASKEHEERGEECAERRKVEESSHGEHRALTEPKRTTVSACWAKVQKRGAYLFSSC